MPLLSFTTQTEPALSYSLFCLWCHESIGTRLPMLPIGRTWHQEKQDSGASVVHGFIDRHRQDQQ